MSQVIKNIIFDLGGVLLNLDYSLTTNAFRKIAPDFWSLDAIYTNCEDKKLFEEFEVGIITPQQFRSRIRTYLQNNVDDKVIDSAWNAMLLDFPDERLRFLERICSKHRCFLLSNTNQIHFQAYTQILKRTFGVIDLSGIFEKEYFSHKLGMRKPNKEIFELLLSENNLTPSETLFIDDSPHHIQSGINVGLQTLLLDKNHSIIEKLSYLSFEG